MVRVIQFVSNNALHWSVLLDEALMGSVEVMPDGRWGYAPAPGAPEVMAPEFMVAVARGVFTIRKAPQGYKFAKRFTQRPGPYGYDLWYHFSEEDPGGMCIGACDALPDARLAAGRIVQQGPYWRVEVRHGGRVVHVAEDRRWLSKTPHE